MGKVLNKKEILVIGFNTIDIVLGIKEDIISGKKIYADSMIEYCGGQAANCAYTLAKLGHKVTYIGKFGDDKNGFRSLESLRELNIDISKSEIVENCKNHIGIIVINELTGERTIVMRKDKRLSMDNYDTNCIDLRNIDLVYSDGNESKFTLSILRLANKLGIDIVLDIEKIDENILYAVPYVTALVAPGEIITKLANEEKIDLALKKLNKKVKMVIATLGDKGSLGICCHGELIQVPAEKCCVKDTTGAGDAYHAGFISSIVSGKNFLESMQIATTIARMKCEVAGPRIDKEIII